MQVFELHTNEGRRFVRSTTARLQAAMYAYIRAKREKGVLLADIIFCWTPITIGTI